MGGNPDKPGRKYNSILYTILIPYAVYMMVILIVFSGMVGVIGFRSARTIIRNSLNRTLEQVYQTSDILLEYNFSYYYNLFYEDRMDYLLENEEIDPNDYPKIIDYMLDCVGRDLITYSIYLIDERRGVVFSSNEGVFSVEDFHDQEILDFLEQRNQDRFLVRELTGILGNAHKKRKVITYCFQDEETALVINIDQEKYQSLIGKNLGETSVTTEVISSDGILISGEGESVGKRIADSYLKEIITSNHENGMFDRKIGKDKYYISWRNSRYFGWVYVGKANYDDLISEFYLYSWTIVAVAMFFVLLGLWATYVLTKKIYGPLRKLVGHVDTKRAGKEKYHDEYELLNITLNELEDSVNEMQTAKYRDLQTRKGEMLQKLLYGDINENTAEEELAENGITWSGRIFCVVNFCFNHLESLKAIYSRTDMKLFCFAMINILEEYFTARGIQAYGIEEEDYAICLIMRLEEAYESSETYALKTFPNENVTDIQKLLMGAKSELERLLKPATFFVSVGRSVIGFERIHRSWLDTKYTRIYRFIRGPQLITLFTEHMESYESGVPFPWEIEKRLLASIKTANVDLSIRILEEFFKAIQKMAPDEMRWAFNQIMTSLFRVSMMNGYRMRDGSPLDWKNWTNKLNSTDTAYEMQGVLRQLMMNLHAQTDNDFSMKRLTAERIKEYVDKHYHNYTLTVTEIAAYTGLSINY